MSDSEDGDFESADEGSEDLKPQQDLSSGMAKTYSVNKNDENNASNVNNEETVSSEHYLPTDNGEDANTIGKQSELDNQHVKVMVTRHNLKEKESVEKVSEDVKEKALAKDVTKRVSVKVSGNKIPTEGLESTKMSSKNHSKVNSTKGKIVNDAESDDNYIISAVKDMMKSPKGQVISREDHGIMDRPSPQLGQLEELSAASALDKLTGQAQVKIKLFNN